MQKHWHERYTKQTSHKRETHNVVQSYKFIFKRTQQQLSQGVVLSQADDSVSSSVSSSPSWAHGGMETDATISDETYEIFKNIIIAH